jgi:sigma-B regulation protein RsbQ
MHSIDPDRTMAAARKDRNGAQAFAANLSLLPRPVETSPNPVFRRHNVQVSGSGARTMMFAHGFGCDQTMWEPVARNFEQDFRVVLFDYVGHGRSDLTAYSAERYASLDGYADDVVEIGRALDLKDAVFVGHSVSAMIGALASLAAPGMFAELVMVGPSPRYIDDDGYRGGFSRAQIDELLEFLADNHLGWSAAMAPAIMGNADRPELGARLENSFCSTDPDIARDFARATFLSDNRRDLAAVLPRTLVLQCSDDIIAPVEVGEYVHAQLPNSEFRMLAATGHCPNLSAPDEVTAAIREFL